MQFGSAMIVTGMTALPGWSFNAYSFVETPMFPGMALVGGWATQADVGPDQLYTTSVNGGELSSLQWTTSPYGSVHLNDPTVVQPTSDANQDRTGWNYMFVTSLNNQWTSFEDITTHNNVAIATSVGNGPWTLQGDILQDAWSPTALQYGDHIDIISNDHLGRLQVSSVAENGWQELSHRYFLDSRGGELHGLNPSVAYLLDGRLLLVSNGFGRDGGLGDIVAFISSDNGHTFSPWSSAGPSLIHSEDHMLLTPEVKVTGQHSIELTFSEDGHYTMRWDLEIA